MAIDSEKLKEIKRLLGEIDKSYSSMGQKNPFEFDVNKVQNADQAIKDLENTLDAVEAKARTINGSFGDLVDILQAVSGELKGQDKILKDAQRGLKSNLKILTDQVQKLKFEEQGYGIESEKNVRIMLKKAQQAKNFALENAKLLTKELDVEVRKGKIYQRNTNTLAQITDAQKAAVLIANEEAKLLQDSVDKIQARVSLEDQFNAKLLFSVKLAGGFDKALQKAGLPALGIADAIEKTREEFIASNVESDKAGQKYFVLVGLIKNLGKNFLEALSFQNMLQLGVATLFKTLVDIDKASGEFAKNNGISYRESVKLRDEMSKVAENLGNINISSKDLMESQENLNKIFGSSVVFSDKMTSDFAELTKLTKMSAETAEIFAKEAFNTGKGAKTLTNEFNLQAFELNRQKGLQMSAKQIQDAIGKSSKSLQLTFKGNSKELANQVISARALGTTLDGVEKISQSLLDFESSIASELEAELLLGKEINLERARAAALQGDSAKVAEEVMKNSAIMNAFQTKNVIAQQAAAKSLGMSREELANMVNEQQKLQIVRDQGNESMEAAQKKYNDLRNEGLTAEQAAKKVGDESLQNQLESTSLAERFEAVMVRVQEIFIQLATPILKTVDGMNGMENAAQKVASIIKKMAGYYMAIQGAMFAMKTMQNAIIAYETRKLALNVAQAGAASVAASAVSLGLGVAAVIAGAVSIMAAVSTYMMDDGIIPGGKSGYGDRVLLGPEGMISFNNKDTIVAGTNLFADDMVSQPPGAVNMDMGNNKMVEKMDKLIEKTEDLISVTMREKAVRLEDGSILGQLISYQGRRLQ